MRITPMTEAQIQAEVEENARKFGPWRNGIYTFEITEAAETTSAAGNEMIVLDVTVYDEDGEKRMVKDYLLEAIAVKLKHCADCVGAGDKYAKGTLTSVDFYGKTGRLKLGIQAGKDGYPAKNVIRDYIVEPESLRAPAVKQHGAPHTAAPARSVKDDLNDEVPF